MGSTGRGTVHSPQVEFRCQVCGERVATEMRRHKTMGAFVPLWGPGPCHNRVCAAYAGPDEPAGDVPAPPGRRTGAPDASGTVSDASDTSDASDASGGNPAVGTG
ncbi:hypothetical protein [Streptomyces sp. NPDC058953]|uniref:hypothetical protein n=1 Tax=unclassified Streptomyces TaxID=2593676 RepID=UPI0036AA421F